jgi:hypothetical protein
MLAADTGGDRGDPGSGWSWLPLFALTRLSATDRTGLVDHALNTEFIKDCACGRGHNSALIHSMIRP